MASNYWTPGRQRLLRLQAAFVRMNDIVKDMFDIIFSAQLGYPYPSLTIQWRGWCYENYVFVQRYPFWKKVAIERYKKRLIPILDSVDVSFFSYLITKIDSECAAMKLFQETRNLIAHMTDTELNETEFQDRIQMPM